MRLFACFALLAVLSAAEPAPALADDAAAENLVGNTLFGWTDFPKSFADEVEKRGPLGLITGPVVGAMNVAVRYTGNAIDVVSVPLGGGNSVSPPALPVSNDPPIVVQ